jgi:hypothetical protein
MENSVRDAFNRAVFSNLEPNDGMPSFRDAPLTPAIEDYTFDSSPHQAAPLGHAAASAAGPAHLMQAVQLAVAAVQPMLAALRKETEASLAEIRQELKELRTQSLQSPGHFDPALAELRMQLQTQQSNHDDLRSQITQTSHLHQARLDHCATMLQNQEAKLTTYMQAGMVNQMQSRADINETDEQMPQMQAPYSAETGVQSASMHGVMGANITPAEASMSSSSVGAVDEMFGDHANDADADVARQMQRVKKLDKMGKTPSGSSHVKNWDAFTKHDDLKNFNYDMAAFEHTKQSWMERQHMYKFEESIWDLSMFCFMPIFPSTTSIFMALLTLLNVFMQVFMSLAIWSAFTAQPLDHQTVEQLEHWRTTVGHDYRWMDSVTGQSLARQVCDQANGLFMSGTVQNTLGEILEYAPHEDHDATTHIKSKFIGKILVLCCCFIWWNNCFLAFRQLIDLAEALWMIPSGKTSKVMSLTEQHDDVCLVRMARIRKVWCCGILLVRFTINIALFYIGTLYLILEKGLKDMILNAVALQIVLNIDELLYQALAPANTAKFISSLEPLPKTIRALRSWKYKGCDLEKLLILFFQHCFGDSTHSIPRESTKTLQISTRCHL